MALPNKAKIPVGTVLAGKYRITREIGRGGMAAVYEAANVDIGKRVAIKVLAQELTASAVVVERFLREARAAAAIRSPYICDIYDSGRLDDGRPFLVLELLEGESLYERMTKIRWLDIDTTLTIMTQTCRGLTKAHAAQIVHRDLKPENIFLTKDEEGNLLSKILDFGLAKFYSPMEGGGPQARLTREGAVFGTPAYMSPEQVRGQGAVDHRADLWALGCIVYECFTGRTVWSTEQGVAMTFAQIANAPLPRPAVYRPDMPEAFTAWFDRALNRDIQKRFQTAKGFCDELVAVFYPERSSLESASSSRPIGQLLGGIPSNPSMASVRVFPPAQSLSSQNVIPDAITEPPPSPSPSVNGMATERASAAPSPDAPTSGSPSKLGFVASPSPRDNTDTAVPPKPKSRSLRNAAFIVGGLAVTGGVAFIAWTQLGTDPQVRVGTSGTASNSAAPPLPSATPSANPSTSAAPVARPEVPAPAWMTQVREAQQAITTGDYKNANKLLKEAFDRSAGHGVPRTMLEHLAVASSSAGDRGPCRLTGLARPRAYDLASPSAKPLPAGRPSIAVTARGPVVTWTDAHEGPEHAYSVALDDALRDAGAPVDVTPEGLAVTRPELRRVGEKLVLAYGDSKGPEAGVHARLLDAEGRIAGASIAVMPPRAGVYWPGIAANADGSLFIGWTAEGADSDSEDLFFRRLAPSLDPTGDVVRATDLVPAGPSRPRVRTPSLAIAGDALFLAYRMERDPQRVIQQMRLPLADAAKGLEPSKKGDRRVDRSIGEVVLVNTDKAKSDNPALACSSGGCFLVWHGEGATGGASAAFVEPAKAQPMWRRKFSRTGTRPGVGVAANGQAQVVWYEGGKVLIAALSRDGVGPATKIARISGDQPIPSVVAGNRPGEWYVAWLDYETGHLEAYAARVQCK
ncbi:Serine/threonine protein kinase [Minicystis rosea]|nr:Serine/threonine protein kinase [Minicystis rosea]